MQPARIAELLRPFVQEANDQRPAANDALYQHISTYIDILQHWNARINLTAIRTEEEIVTRHFGESLFAARHLFPKVYPVPPVSSVLKDVDLDPNVTNAQSPKPEAQSPKPEAQSLKPEARVADLGSGAGFPGIP